MSFSSFILGYAEVIATVDPAKGRLWTFNGCAGLNKFAPSLRPTPGVNNA